MGASVICGEAYQRVARVATGNYCNEMDCGRIRRDCGGGDMGAGCDVRVLKWLLFLWLDVFVLVESVRYYPDSCGGV